MFSDLHEDCYWYRERAHQLEMAIKRHFEQTIGQNACWENDEELWKVLDDGINRTYPHSETPSMEEMMIECVKYCASRQQFQSYEKKTIDEHGITYIQHDCPIVDGFRGQIRVIRKLQEEVKQLKENKNNDVD